jgi:long-chain acyl-CoA synthetase
MSSVVAEPISRPWLAKYPSKVDPNLEVPPVLLTQMVQRTVERWPTRDALVFYGARWTYRELWEEAGALAARLAADGVGPGDRIAISLPNCPYYPVALLASWWLGAAVVQVSPLLVGEDLQVELNDARPKALITVEILYPRLERLTGYRPPLVYVGRLRSCYPWSRRPFVNLVLRRRGHPTSFPSGPTIRRLRLRERTRAPPPIFEGDPAAVVAVLQYTGGTTGRPKAAMLSHRNLVANVFQCNAWNTSRVAGEETILASIPFFHIYGLTIALLKGLADGSTIVLQVQPEVREILHLVDRYRPTQFPGVPALYTAFVRQPDLGKFRIRSIKYCVSGSAPLTTEVQRVFEVATGGKLIEGYGLSEASPVTHANPEEGERRLGSIGLPVPLTDQRVVDAETGLRVLGVGEVGELTVRGPQVMLGYLGQPEETAGVLRDGWLFTGDLARLDAEGYAYIVDRKKDVINVGGFKVYPREVEEVLLEHPAVSEAAVVGVPDVDHGEVPRAFVVLKSGAATSEHDLIAFVRERIAHYKAPRAVVFRNALPRSGVQKVLRRALKEELA